MIEKVILDYLSDELNVGVYMEQPPENTSTFVLIEKTGSSENDHLYNATIAVQSYSDSLFRASLLNEDVKAAMHALPDEEDSVTNVTLNSDYNFTDTSTKRYRYQAVFDVVHY